MVAPSSTRSTIICCQVRTKPVHRVMRPNRNVMLLNQMRGPKVRTATVQGSWNAMLDRVKTKMATEKRLPWSKPKSESIEVTDALEMTPLSRRSRLQRIPAIVHSRRSTFSRMRL